MVNAKPGGSPFRPVFYVCKHTSRSYCIRTSITPISPLFKSDCFEQVHPSICRQKNKAFGILGRLNGTLFTFRGEINLSIEITYVFVCYKLYEVKRQTVYVVVDTMWYT